MFAPYTSSHVNPTPHTPSTSTTRANHERLAPPPVAPGSVPAGLMPGRVRLLPNEQLPAYMFSLTGTSSTSSTGQQQAPPVSNLGAMQQSTALSHAYFSSENTQMLQNALRKGVFDATGTVVHEQSTEQLQLVMRSVFLQHSRNQTHSADVIREQIQEMNTKVTDYCVPVVVSNLKQHQQYLVDVSTMPMPMHNQGMATSQAGSRSLELKPPFF